MKRLKKYLMRHRRDGEPESEDTFPKLPLPGARPLTNAVLMPQSSPLFLRLPVEVRQCVYDKAFTNRTIHVDLRYGHALKAGSPHPSFFDGPQEVLSTPKQWRWRSSVCHRYRKVVDGDVRTLDFWLDRCWCGDQTYCKSEGLLQKECWVGVTGWLLSCRQAYLELIPRLYSENTFFLGNVEGPLDFHYQPPLSRDIDLRFVRQRLADIRKLEMMWNLTSFTHSRDSGPSAFQHLLCTLMTTFPGLQDVKIAIQTIERCPHPGDVDVTSLIIKPVDQVITHYGDQLGRFELIVGFTYYEAARAALGTTEAAEMKAHSTSFRKFYRRVGHGGQGYWMGYLPDDI